MGVYSKVAPQLEYLEHLGMPCNGALGYVKDVVFVGTRLNERSSAGVWDSLGTDVQHRSVFPTETSRIESET